MEAFITVIVLLVLSSLTWNVFKAVRTNKKRKAILKEIEFTKLKYIETRIIFLNKNGTPSLTNAIDAFALFVERQDSEYIKIMNNHGDIPIEYREIQYAFDNRFTTHAAKAKDIYFIMANISDRLDNTKFNDSMGSTRTKITNCLYGQNDSYFDGPGEQERLEQFRDEAYKNILESFKLGLDKRLSWAINDKEEIVKTAINCVKNIIELRVYGAKFLRDKFEDLQNDEFENLRKMQAIYTAFQNIFDDKTKEIMLENIVKSGLSLWLNEFQKRSDDMFPRLENYLFQLYAFGNHEDFSKNSIVVEFSNLKPNLDSIYKLYADLRSIPIVVF